MTMTNGKELRSLKVKSSFSPSGENMAVAALDPGAVCGFLVREKR